MEGFARSDVTKSFLTIPVLFQNPVEISVLHGFVCSILSRKKIHIFFKKQLRPAFNTLKYGEIYQIYILFITDLCVVAQITFLLFSLLGLMHLCLKQIIFLFCQGLSECVHSAALSCCYVAIHRYQC